MGPVLEPIAALVESLGLTGTFRKVGKFAAYLLVQIVGMCSPDQVSRVGLSRWWIWPLLLSLSEENMFDNKQLRVDLFHSRIVAASC